MNIFFETLGWIGSFCFLLAYYKLITGKWNSHQTEYHVYNIIGSLLFVLNGAYYTAWAVLFINLAWGIIAGYGLYKDWKVK
ncbi:CBU_0592 family membrane protein [Robertkochia solimangrovi]|uniref:CBU_0592 family membrane protein n=1 Tax=Robertkochia solimangrovi TaxID=2213046 RepID=UPI00117EFBAC|nr:hypothetical protein [Robertkochia solimangrovi]TRZ41970.1 hypothetical protein DMZ48_15135 [Robertkochia solimangrovi]